MLNDRLLLLVIIWCDVNVNSSDRHVKCEVCRYIATTSTRHLCSRSQASEAACSTDCTMKLSLGRLLHVPDINEARSGEVDCFVQYTWPVQSGEAMEGWWEKGPE